MAKPYVPRGASRSPSIGRTLSVWTLLSLTAIVTAKFNVKKSYLGNEYEGVDDEVAVTMQAQSVATPITFSANPTAIQHGQDVTVTWTDVPSAHDDDIIAVYCPFEDSKPSDYLDKHHAGKHTAGGSGSKRFENLLNMRCNYGFRYLRKTGHKQYEVVAESNLVTMVHGDREPLQGHLALTDNLDEMRVMWTSGADAPSVHYSKSKDELLAGNFLTQSGHFQTYTADMMCEHPSNKTAQKWFRHPGLLHDVLLTDLEQGTTYFYTYGDTHDPPEKRSRVAHFTTRKQPSPELTSQFIVYGDMNVYEDATSTVGHVAAELDSTDVVLHVGDVSYAEGNAYQWEQFFRVIQPISERVPYMVSIGNHEYDHDGGGEHDPSGAPGNGFKPSWGNYGDDSNGECGVPMFYRFHMPDNGKDLWWYSFDQGNVHVLQMSTEHDYTPGSEQYAWIEHDLASVDRSVTPFVVFTGHRPMYSSENCTDDPSASDFPVSLGMQRAFEHLLMQHRVDIAIWGHQHSYERTCAVYNNVCTSGAPVHVVAGTAGAGLEDGAFDLGTSEEWSVFHWVDHGYLRVSTTRDALTCELVANEDGRTVDTVTIARKYFGGNLEGNVSIEIN